MIRFSVLLLLAVIVLKTGLSQQTVFDKKLNIHISNASAEEVLEVISEKIDYFFTYDPSILSETKRFSLKYTDIRLQSLLDSIFQNPNLEFSILKDHIIISISQANDQIHKENGEIKESNIFKLKGNIIHSLTKETIPYVSVGILNTTLGMVSNESGEFQINIPNTFKDSILYVAHIGFKPFTIAIKNLLNENITIELDESIISVQEVIIRNIDPEKLVRKAVLNRDNNYSQETKLTHAFYREAVLNDDEAATINEAIIKIRKSAYKTTLVQDKIVLEKSRKIINSELTDTVFLKLRDGLYSSLQLDIMKHLFEFADVSMIKEYSYNMVDLVSYNNSLAHVVEFKPKNIESNAVYRGRMFIDNRSFALIRAEFNVDMKMQKKLTDFVVKKSRRVKVKPISANYIISYKEFDKKYYLNHVRVDLAFRIKKKKELFASKYKTFFETVVFEIQDYNDQSFENKEYLKKNLILIDNNFSYDAEFWADKNFIPLEQSLEDAINNLNVKLEIED